MDYATTDNPNGKYREGTIVEVKAPKKMDSGVFVMGRPFGGQYGPNPHFECVRMTKRGKPCATFNHINVRFHFGNWLDDHATVIGHVDNAADVEKARAILYG